MKKVGFGSDSSLNPTGSWESMGLANGVIEGELIGFFNYDESNYAVSRVTGAFSNSKYDEGEVMVNRVVADLYRDGSGVLYFDQEQDHACRKFEELLNSEKVRSLLERGVPVSEICSGHRVDKCFDLLASGNEISVLGINHEVFDRKKYAIEHCNRSFSVMYEEMERLYEKLRQLEEEKKQGQGFGL